jgi:hypothetical protein
MVLGVGFSFAWVEEGYHGFRFVYLVGGDREKKRMRRGEGLEEDDTGTLSWPLLFFYLQQQLLPMSSLDLTGTNIQRVLSLLSRYRCYHTGREDGTKALYMPCLSRKRMSRQRNHSTCLTQDTTTDDVHTKGCGGGGRPLHSFVLRSWRVAASHTGCSSNFRDCKLVTYVYIPYVSP